MHDAETLIAAIHRDWGEAQGNYDEFRFFSGLRPSEEIALVLSDTDLVNGIVSVNKARVAGVDRCQTKTGEDRRVSLCPRARAVLKRQLVLRVRLVGAGAIHHDHAFSQDSGEPFANLVTPAKRWRATLDALKLRYRRPYTARHSSASWNLTIGKNALSVAKEHGHSIGQTVRWNQISRPSNDRWDSRPTGNRREPDERSAAATVVARCMGKEICPSWEIWQ